MNSGALIESGRNRLKNRLPAQWIKPGGREYNNLGTSCPRNFQAKKRSGSPRQLTHLPINWNAVTLHDGYGLGS
jgi:hypothetical protein